MPRIQYEEINFRKATLPWIAAADKIASDYAARGFKLSLRQLYYQLVTVNFFANNEANYNKLGRVVSDARLAGLLDWDHVEDRGREAYGVHWEGHLPESKASAIRNAQLRYSLDLWEGQERRIEVWVEKQALEEVAEMATRRRRSGYFACKGYVSQSEMWMAGQRLQDVILSGQTPLILHLGDHDPSGMDMTRDIQERLSMFTGVEVDVRRIALNMDQIAQYNPPPNPAKMTDSRAAEYVAEYGRQSWELDSMRPETLVTLIRDTIDAELNIDMWEERVLMEKHERAKFDDIADAYTEIADMLDIDSGDADFYNGGEVSFARSEER